MSIILRPMVDADLPTFILWLNRPHVIKWYREPQDWIDEFAARDAEYSFINHFIAESDGVPFGFCQYYACRYSGEDWNGYEYIYDAYSIDYLIGEVSYLHHGFGKTIVGLLIEQIKKQEDCKRITVRPEPENDVSRGVLLSCGFVYRDEFDIFVYKL